MQIDRYAYALLLALVVLFGWAALKWLEKIDAAVKRIEQALRDLAARH